MFDAPGPTVPERQINLSPNSCTRRVTHSRDQRFSTFVFTIPTRWATASQVAAALRQFHSIAEFAVATHDRDSAVSHVQGAFTCPDARLTPHEAVLRFSELRLPPGVLEIRPLVRGKGFGRKPFVGYAYYLTHEDPTQQARGKAVYPRSSIVTNVTDLWERVDAWLEVCARADLRAGRRPQPYTDLDTARRLLAHGMVSLAVVREVAPELWLNQGSKLRSAVLTLSGIPLSQPDGARLAPLGQRLLAAETVARERAEANAAAAAVAAEARRAEHDARELAEAARREADREANQAARAVVSKADQGADERAHHEAELRSREARELEMNAVMICAVAGILGIKADSQSERDRLVRERIASDAALDSWEAGATASDMEALAWTDANGVEHLRDPELDVTPATNEQLWSWLADEFGGETEARDEVDALRACLTGMSAELTLHDLEGRGGDGARGAHDAQAFNQSLALRKRIALFPDWVQSPAPHPALSRAQRDAIAAVA